MAGTEEPGERMILTGTVRNVDGLTPAADIIVYAYQANSEGLYANGSAESRQSRRHGRLRAWARTGPDGRYTFDTIKPAPYPDRSMAAHIHIMIGEPGRPPYYLDQVVFAGEFGVTTAYRTHQELRGGSGIVALRRTSAGQLLANRDIRLEPHP
jgi:protocatechuate 3,4-dioxygenase beta subunit